MKDLIDRLPENLKDFVDQDQPFEKKMMVAEGLIPLPPSDLVKILVVFINDENEDIQKAAKNSLKDIPEDQMKNILSDPNSFPELLDYSARNFELQKYSQTILLNRSTLDSTFAYIAEKDTSLANLEIIANNKQRILRSVSIVEALSRNSLLSRSLMDDVLSFLSLHLKKSDDLKKFIGENVEKDDEPEDLDIDEFTESFFDDAEISEELVEEHDDTEEYDEEDEDIDAIKESILQKINKLTMAQKIKVALQGNREARRILIRDPNKIISSSVLRNAKISETEVVQISQSKVVGDEILRQISDNRKWTKLYQVKLSLVKNPKTPSHISLNYLRHLREIDIKSIMRDKNLPGVITIGARNLYKEARRTR